MKRKTIFNAQEIRESIERLAREILAKHESTDDLVIVGIRTGGAYLATRLQETMAEMNVPKPPVGVLDITLYRDDWTRIGPKPEVGKTDLPFSLDDKIIILVDDVLFTGRTVRAAMDALMDFGRPKRIELFTLVDRGDGDRELPIKADYSGGVWSIASQETINVYLEEQGFEDHVAIEEK